MRPWVQYHSFADFLLGHLIYISYAVSTPDRVRDFPTSRLLTHDENATLHYLWGEHKIALR